MFTDNLIAYDDNGLYSTGLLEEVLVDGCGTKIVLPPEISSYPLKAVKADLLESLINDAFESQNKKLVPEYFSLISGKDPTVFLDNHGQSRGGAITYSLGGHEYMCKLFTLKDYEGLGIATAVIDTIILQKGNLVWRSSVANKEANCFYDKLIERYNGLKTEPVNGFYTYMVGIGQQDQAKVKYEVQKVPVTMEKRG